jgi:hypothetical protein
MVEVPSETSVRQIESLDETAATDGSMTTMISVETDASDDSMMTMTSVIYRGVRDVHVDCQETTIIEDEDDSSSLSRGAYRQLRPS